MIMVSPLHRIAGLGPGGGGGGGGGGDEVLILSSGR